MRSLAAVAVFGLLAGCASDASEPVTDAVADGPTTHEWGLVDCDFVIVRVPAAPEDLQPLLPPGFTPAVSGEAAFAGLPTAEFHLDAYECRHGVAFDGSPIAFQKYGSFYVPVVPPEALREPGVDAYFVKLDTLQSDENTRAAFEAAGLPVHEGDAKVEPGIGVWTVELGMGGAGGFVLEEGVVGPASDQAAPLPFIEFTPVAGGGLARWHARLHDATFREGLGLFTPSPGLASEVAGPERRPVQFLAGTWNLDEADVTFPIAWPA